MMTVAALIWSWSSNIHGDSTAGAQTRRLDIQGQLTPPFQKSYIQSELVVYIPSIGKAENQTTPESKLTHPKTGA